MTYLFVKWKIYIFFFRESGYNVCMTRVSGAKNSGSGTINIELEVLAMKGHLNKEGGSVAIDLDVISKYAGLTAIECFGIVGMGMISVKDGLTRLLKRESLTKGVEVTIEDNQINIRFHVIIAYGVSIATVADNLMNNVKYKVEQFTGMEVGRIDIFVEGVRVID